MEIRFRDVSFSKGRKEILKNVNLVCKKGEITTILSDDMLSIQTIFSLLLCKNKPKNGEISFGKKESLKRKKVGYFCKNAFDTLFMKTVREELSLPLKNVRKMDDNDLLKMDALETVFLSSSYLDREIATLSKGEKQKVAFASFLLSDYDILLMEDPFFLFNDIEKKDLARSLKKMKKKKTILFGTSSSTFAQEISDFIYLISGNKVIVSGDSEMVFSPLFMKKARLSMPPILEFMDAAIRFKNVRMMYRSEINDLIKDIYRYVK